ncbi:hypothetical protein HDU76_008822 [Blyttiomyces sp. JEL0837]|nr:hypothetical protein HDU76_008822 [Blyttiomyces sp. JEL0837]
MASSASTLNASCLFCKLIKGVIPAHKLIETELSFAFLDINPLSAGHAVSSYLLYCDDHAEFFHQVPDEHLADILPLAKKVALALGCPNYNLLQNNGKLAHQEVPHVHFHIIPKNEGDGLGIGWKSLETDHAKFGALAAELREKIAKL